MKQKEFKELKRGDIVLIKNRRAIVGAIGSFLAEIQYLDTRRRAYKTARQIIKKEGL